MSAEWLGILAAVSTTISAAALGVIALQLRLQRRQMRLEALTVLHEQLLSSDANTALRKIYAERADSLRDPKTVSMLNGIEYVLGMYDLIGHRARLGLVPAADLLETDWPVILRIDQQLGPFVLRERERRRPPAPYKEGYTWLVELAKQHRDKVAPDWEPIVFARETEDFV